MSSVKRSIMTPGISEAPHPIIIGHSCGYLGYNEKPYSRAATREAYKDCDYLEIDLTQRKGEWWYYHFGTIGECKDNEEGNREDGISFDDFIEDFGIAAENAPNKKPKTGIFLDMKKRLNYDQVDDLMKDLNRKYNRKKIPAGTPLMIFTGRGWIPRLQSVYRHTTLYFVKWLYRHKKAPVMTDVFCPRLTLVTREIDLEEELVEWKGRLEPFRKSALNQKEKEWFRENLNHRFFWGFNPEVFWLFKTYKFEKIIRNQITVIPWFHSFTSKFRKSAELKFAQLESAEPKSAELEEAEEFEIADAASIPKKLPESYNAWIRVILGILRKYWLFKTSHDEEPKPLPWGIITYAPNILKDALQKWSFSDIK